MAKQSRSNLEGRATGVKIQRALGGNSALVIGQLLLDYIASAATSFDPSRPYAPGELAIWAGRIVTCFKATSAGESPSTAADKWTDDVVSNIAMLGTDGPNFPVLASALKEYVSQRINEVNAGGGGTALQKADEEMMNNGVNDANYVTPKLVALLLSKVLEVLTNLDPPTLDAVAKAGTLATIGRTTQLLYLMGGLYLGNIPTTTEDFPTLVMDKTGKVWQRAGAAVITQPIVYNFTNGIDYEAIPAVVTPLLPSYIGRFDQNNCDWFRGWFVDINNPTVSPLVRIVRDGVVIATIKATIERTDVRDYLVKDNRLPSGSTYAIYGWSYVKDASDKDGKEHSYEAFGGTSSTKATTDVGAPVKVTCGSTVVNPPAVNNPPVISGIYTDQTVYAAGDVLLDPITGLFQDDDALTYSATMGNGDPLMQGIVFTPTDARPFKILGSFPNQQQPIKLIATDTAKQSTPKLFLLTVARQVGVPVTLVSRAFGGDTECLEGSSARVEIVNTMSNGAQSNYTGGGTYEIVAPYPDQMTIRTDANAVGLIDTKETVVADVQVTLRFKFPDESTITGTFWVRNKTVATSPIVSYIIDTIAIPEGSSGVSQVYAVHADGQFTEVTQADNSSFELIAPYPNGMGIAFGNTARALVSTAKNSITADVEVKIRFRFAGGGTLDGKIIVQNVDDSTNPTTPTGSLVIDRMSIYFPYAWHDVSFGKLSENVVLLVNVAGQGGKDATVFSQYVQSQNDPTFGLMSKLDYSKNNVPPNILPAGFTHWCMFNDEQFSTALRTFRAKIVNVANSQVEAVYQAPAATPDHADVQIYPTSN